MVAVDKLLGAVERLDPMPLPACEFEVPAVEVFGRRLPVDARANRRDVPRDGARYDVIDLGPVAVLAARN